MPLDFGRIGRFDGVNQRCGHRNVQLNLGEPLVQVNGHTDFEMRPRLEHTDQSWHDVLVRLERASE